MRASLVRLAFGMIAMTAIAGAQPASKPLPDRDALLKNVKRRMQGNDAAARYFYHEQIVDFERDDKGNVIRRSVRVYKARPDRWGAPIDWILLSRNGVAVPAAEVDRQEREWRERDSRAGADRGRESAGERAKREEQERAEMKEEDRAVEEAFQVSEGTVVRREVIDGRNTIVMSFVPKKQSDPQTFLGKVMSRAKGRVWIDESTYDVVRFEGQTIETVTYGWGLVARVHEGGKLTFDRRPVDNDVWLPSAYTLVGDVRLFLLKETRFDREVHFSNFSRN
jgi:hypothetical protein